MKLIYFSLPIVAVACLCGCHQDEYEYRHVTRHTTVDHEYSADGGGDAVAGTPTHLGNPGAAETFKAEGTAQ